MRRAALGQASLPVVLVLALLGGSAHARDRAGSRNARMAHGSGFTTWNWNDCGPDRAFVLLEPGTREALVLGDDDDFERAERLTRDTDAIVLYARLAGRRYRVTDRTTVRRVRELVGPLRELGRAQARLGARQADLGTLQARLGGRQAELGARQADLAADAWDGGSATAGRQRELGARQRELGARQRVLGAKQRQLGDEQRRLGQRQRAMAPRILRQVESEVRRAVRAGQAREL